MWWLEAIHADKALAQSQIRRTINPKSTRGAPLQAAIDAPDTSLLDSLQSMIQRGEVAAGKAPS